MSLLKLWFIRNPVLVSYSICMRQGSADLSGSQSALTCLCVCARARLGLREFNLDNSTAYGIVREKIKQKPSTAMRYHWVTDRVLQKQFDVYWRPGRENLAGYHTKHHSAQHHKDMCHLILHEANSLQVM
jgi:hypothetical protein